MASFDWIDLPDSPGADTYRLMLIEARNEARAKRRNLDLRIDARMYEIRAMEIQRDQICDKEDKLQDEIDRIKKLKQGAV
jgi:hypothetical protein